jgi:hypothetical protein
MALNASGLPQLDDGGAVRSGASTLQTAVGKVATRAQSIQSTWSTIAAHYDAPEASLVHTAMDKPVTAADNLASKTDTAAGALSTYGDRLDELNAQRAQLAADIASFNAHREEVTSESSGFLGWRDWTGWEKQDLLNKEEDLNDRAAAFAAAVDEAQRTCANAISAIFGGPEYKAADRAAVDDANVYGLSEEGYDQLGLSGENAWGAPEGWTDTSWMSAGYMLGRGAVRSVTGLWDMGKALTGFGEDGEASAAWSGLWQLTKDAFYLSPLAMATGITTTKQADESSQRLLGVGKSILGIGTWKTSGWNTAGGFIPDVVLAVATGGTAAAAKGGVRGAMRGALDGALARLAPTTATRIGDLNTALRTSMRTSYGTALTGIRDIGYRGIDAFADIRRTVSDAPTNARRWADDLGRQLGGPDPLPAGGPRDLPTGTTRLDDSVAAMQRPNTAAVTDGWPTHRPSGGSTPSTSPGAGTPASTYAGDAATGMRGTPSHTNTTTRVDVGDDLMPRAREPFGQNGDLAPLTRYEVRGRGVFYTNADGVVEFVEPMRKSVGIRELMSSDLRHPLPNVTYKVDDYAYFHTDDLGRTDHVHVENLELRPDTKASPTVNRGVAGGTPDTDAGHLLARGLGGAREEINLVQMVRDLNRGWGGRSLEAQNSVRHLELELEKALRRGDTASFDLRVSRPAPGETLFDYRPMVNGKPLSPEPIVIRNE